jgi:hypothetical protein
MPSFAVEGGEMKSVACIEDTAGRHTGEQGEEYNVCSRCGKVSEELMVESYAEAQRLADQLETRRLASGG